MEKKEYTNIGTKNYRIHISQIAYLLDKENSDNYIQFWGEKKRFSQRRFDLNCEIAFESWVLAIRRWKELNQADFKFSGEALEQKNSSIENARDLYLP